MKDLNLIPKSYIQSKKNKKRKITMTFSLLVLCILIIAAVALPFGYKYVLKKQSEDLSKVVYKGSGSIETLNQLNTVKALYKQMDDEGSKLDIYGAKTSKLFEEIEKIIPMKFFITNMTMVNKSGSDFDVTLSCICESEDDAATFINYLRKDGSFSNIAISSIKKTTSSGSQALIKNPNEVNSTGIKKYFSFTVNLTYKAGR